MAAIKSVAFTRLTDGTTLLRQPDGSFNPVRSNSDRAALDRLTEEEIERMASSDLNHPPLDDAFWANVGVRPGPKEAISIKLDGDVLSFFRREGRGYQTRINAVLRRYVEAQK